jgi:hypothetical protein
MPPCRNSNRDLDLRYSGELQSTPSISTTCLWYLVTYFLVVVTENLISPLFICGPGLLVNIIHDGALLMASS